MAFGLEQVLKHETDLEGDNLVGEGNQPEDNLLEGSRAEGDTHAEEGSPLEEDSRSVLRSTRLRCDQSSSGTDRLFGEYN